MSLLKKSYTRKQLNIENPDLDKDISVLEQVADRKELYQEELGSFLEQLSTRISYLNNVITLIEEVKPLEKQVIKELRVLNKAFQGLHQGEQSLPIQSGLPVDKPNSFNYIEESEKVEIRPDNLNDFM
jgi:hypothetical protein